MALLEAVMDCGFGNWWVTSNMDFSVSSPYWGIVMTADLDLCYEFVICWWRKSNFILLSWLIWCVFLQYRQDVAYQMRTKTKEECETHYMKNFINNPLFSSTLLGLRKTKDSHFAEGAIPFRRQYPRRLHSLLLFLCWHEKPFTFIPLLELRSKINICLFVCHSYSSVLKSGITLFY